MNTITYGQKSFSNGFDLKKEVLLRLTAMEISFKVTKFFISSPYEKARYNPEYVGQELWLKDKHNDSVCITQTNYEQAAKSSEADLCDYLYGIFC